MVADLLHFAHSRGYELTFGDAYRDERLHGRLGVKAGYGSAWSNHKLRLAATDYYMLPDAPSAPDGLLEYRQALRDVTAQGGFPLSVEWPVLP